MDIVYLAIGGGVILLVIILLILQFMKKKNGSFRIAVQGSPNEVGEPRTRRVLLTNALAEDPDLDIVIFAETKAFLDFEHETNEKPEKLEVGEIDLFKGPSIVGFPKWKQIYSNPKKAKNYFGFFYNTETVKLKYKVGVGNGVSASDDASYLKGIFSRKNYSNTTISVLACQGRSNFQGEDLPKRNMFAFDEVLYRESFSLPMVSPDKVSAPYYIMGGYVFAGSDFDKYEVRRTESLVAGNFGVQSFVSKYDFVSDITAVKGDKFYLVKAFNNKGDEPSTTG